MAGTWCCVQVLDSQTIQPRSRLDPTTELMFRQYMETEAVPERSYVKSLCGFTHIQRKAHPTVISCRCIDIEDVDP